ncbi:hypothetical protein V8E53_007625 [Lactarius tabidus]
MTLVPDWKTGRGAVNGKGKAARSLSRLAQFPRQHRPSPQSPFHIRIHGAPVSSSLPPTLLHTLPPYSFTERSSHSPLPSPCPPHGGYSRIPCPRVIQLDRGSCSQESPPSVTRSTHRTASSMVPLLLMVQQGSWQRYTPGPSSGHISILRGETQVCQDNDEEETVFGQSIRGIVEWGRGKRPCLGSLFHRGRGRGGLRS